MINLLADAKKKEIRAGRTNVVIFNYLVLTACGVGLLALLLGGAYFTLVQTRANAKERVEQNTQSSAAYSDVKTRADTFRGNLATAKQILDKGIVYSDLIFKIAEAIPAGVYLESLNLSAETIGSPITLNARAKSMDRALALKTSFEKRTDLFSNVYFGTITPGGVSSEGSSEGSGGDNQYPVQVGLNVTIKAEALQ